MGIIEENYSELANAIVLQACKDYKDALKRRDVYECNNLERFFKSEYFMDLVRDKISGTALIKEMKKQVDPDGTRLLKRRRANLKGDRYGE